MEPFEGGPHGHGVVSEAHQPRARARWRVPSDLDTVDLFGDGAQEHWYETYEILHRDAPVLRIEGGGLAPGTDAFVLTKHADIALVVKDPERFPSLGQARLGDLANQGMSPEQHFATYHNLMQAAMVSLRPTQELYIRHRKELTDPWVGPGALRHRDMITRHANDLLDEWIDDGAVEFISRFARPLPQRVMASLLGFPLADIPQLAEWGDAVVTAFVHGNGLTHTLTAEQTQEMLARLMDSRTTSTNTSARSAWTPRTTWSASCATSTTRRSTASSPIWRSPGSSTP